MRATKQAMVNGRKVVSLSKHQDRITKKGKIINTCQRIKCQAQNIILDGEGGFPVNEVDKEFKSIIKSADKVIAKIKQEQTRRRRNDE